METHTETHLANHTKAIIRVRTRWLQADIHSQPALSPVQISKATEMTSGGLQECFPVDNAEILSLFP